MSASEQYLRVLAWAGLTSIVVAIGVAFAVAFVPVSKAHPPHADKTAISGMLAWDGEWYRRIVEGGYDFSNESQSSVPFFPLYPDLAAAFQYITGAAPDISLLVVSNAAFVLSCVLLFRLLADRSRGNAAGEVHDRNATTWAVLSLGLFPTAFYFRMAYSESLFLLLSLAAFLAMQRRMPSWMVAFLCGAATGTRAVGVALLLPFVLYLQEESTERRQFVSRVATLTPLACWGLLWFMAYQWAEFGTPVAFIRAQASYDSRPWASPGSVAMSLLSLEPLWGLYDPRSPGYWGKYDANAFPLFNLFFMNPIFFVGSVVLLLIGAWRRWLTTKDVLFGACVCLIPYVAHSYPKCGASLGRYAVVCFPIYIVLGRLLAATRTETAALLLSLSACMLCIYSALFSRWYWFY